MSRLFGIGLIVWICLIIKGDVALAQNGGPNAVALINGQTMLDCPVALLALSSWSHSTDGTIGNSQAIASGCSVIGTNSAYYRTELIGGTNCRLTIANITMQQAGVYDCYGGSGGTGYRSLITVIEHAANVVVYNQSEVVDGDQLNISCSINYTGPASPAPSMRPLPYWTTSPGQDFDSAIYNTSINVVTLMATVTVNKPTVPIFQCQTVFGIAGNTSGYNPTPPADNMTVGSTQKIDVQYPVETISISSTVPTEDKCVSKQETLTCTSNANPPAQYVWTDMNNNTNTTGAVISISYGGEYLCIAYNYIRSQMYHKTGTVTETSCYSPQNLTINGTNCENNFCTCNGNATYADPISITCMANGIPMPSVKWRSDDSFDGLYETIGVTYDGNYTCTASNTYGGNPHNAELTVFVYDCLDTPSISSTPPSPYVEPTTNSNTPIIIGAVIGVIVILNAVATGLFFWYYKRVEESHSGKKERNNKLRLDRRFSWLKKMMPCVSDTKESARSSCLWVSLYILLGIVTGIVTFPIWILLANKYEKNNETSALNTRENGEGNGSGENGRRPTNNSSANHSQPPSTNQMNPIRQEGPYQNESSRENIELNNSLRSRNLLLPDFQPPRPQPAGRPPPPPNKPTMNLSTNRSKDYSANDQTQAANPEHTTYADLPFVPRNTLPTATPVQFLNVSNDTYASLNKT